MPQAWGFFGRATPPIEDHGAQRSSPRRLGFWENKKIHHAAGMGIFWSSNSSAGVLPEVEDYYVASKVLERVRQGVEAVFSSTEVRQHLGLVDLP